MIVSRKNEGKGKVNGDKGTDPKIPVNYSSDHEGAQKIKWEDEAF